MSDIKIAATFAGVHVSGPNAPRTAVVILKKDPSEDKLRLHRLYERIGSTGRMFSDDRVLQILDREGPFAEVMVDCPLSVPPCVSCERPVCPGVAACEDVTVAYMLSLAKKVPRDKRRPINPQTQRLWDVMRQATHAQEGMEPTYSANMAPLVIRARTLQRRLNSLTPAIALKETSIQHSLKELNAALKLPEGMFEGYRNFEKGRRCREGFLRGLEKEGWLAPLLEFDERESFLSSVENFQALIAALVAALQYFGKCEKRPEYATSGLGSVCIPDSDYFLEP